MTQRNIEVIADTGYIIALGVQTDQMHKICTVVHQRQGLMWLPQTVLTEAMYYLKKRLGNEGAGLWLINLPYTKFRLLDVGIDDLTRAGEIMQKYADSKLDFVDSTIIALAERLKITRILTIDKRDFGMVRPQHVETFELLP